MLRHFLLILLPVVAIFAILPGLYSNHLLLFNFMIFMTLAQGINIIYGFTGYLPFGYVGFFGAGAYGFSLMVIHLQAPPLLALPVGAAAAIVLALLPDAAVPPVRRVFLHRQSRRGARRAAGGVESQSGSDHQGPLRHQPQRRVRPGVRLWQRRSPSWR